MREILLGSACIDENGNTTGGEPGDQNGQEVRTDAFYIHEKGWYCIRPKEKGRLISDCMVQAVSNDNIGYSQGERYGVITYVRRGVEIRYIKSKTSCDCSSLVRACIMQAMGLDPGDFYTGSEREVLLGTGAFEYVGEITDESQVQDGDILVTKTPGHTVVVIENNINELYRVQVGSFWNKDYAEQYLSKVKEDGFGDAFIVQTEKHYKVQIGAFVNRNYAAEMVKTVKSKGYDAFITN